MTKRTSEIKVGTCDCGGDIVSYLLEYSSGTVQHVVSCEKCGKDNLDH